jgi:hypothetical protein
MILMAYDGLAHKASILNDATALNFDLDRQYTPVFHHCDQAYEVV